MDALEKLENSVSVKVQSAIKQTRVIIFLLILFLCFFFLNLIVVQCAYLTLTPV